MDIVINPRVESLSLRDPDVVMQLDRLGSLHQCRLSFMRSLVRRIMREQWSIACRSFELDSQGYGTVIYTIKASHHCFSFVLFLFLFLVLVLFLFLVLFVLLFFFLYSCGFFAVSVGLVWSKQDALSVQL